VAGVGIDPVETRIEDYRRMVGKVSWRSKQCKWVVLNPVLNKVTQLREKLSKKCSRDTEFYIGG
jgi:hypothetical protein